MYLGVFPCCNTHTYETVGAPVRPPLHIPQNSLLTLRLYILPRTSVCSMALM